MIPGSSYCRPCGTVGTISSGPATSQRPLLRRFDLMTDVLELDRSRAATWTLGRVLQVAVWDLVRFNEGHIYPAHRTIAEVLLHARAAAPSAF